MTGFGRGESSNYERKFKVEIKSVNHRFSDFVIKIPRFLNPLEDKIRRRLALDIIRGKVDILVHFESFSQKDVAINVNLTLADAYIEALSKLSNRYELGKLQSPTLELLAKIPDVISLERFESTLGTESGQDEIWETLDKAIEAALMQFNQMRNTEGLALVEDIAKTRMQAQKLVDEIINRLPQAKEEQSAKLRERMDDIMTRMEQKPDEARLLTEIAILIDKSCISEEITRLQSHFAQLATILEEKDAIGRKLDFLIQELNRETNTIGAKSSDIGTTNLVVELKSLIEKMREQAHNLE